MDDFLELPIVFLDLETTGVSVSSDRICEIAMVKAYEGEIIADFHRYIDPIIEIPEEVSKVHGLRKGIGPMIDAKPFQDSAQEIFDFLKGADIAGHQIMIFDLPLLVEEFIRAKVDNFPLQGTKFIDTYRNQEKIFPRTLEFSYEQLTGKPFNKDIAHTAHYDASCSLELYFAQVKQYSQRLGESRNDLHNLATRGKQIIDFAGKLNLNDKGLICYAFGKNEGKRVTSDVQYVRWMLNGDFTGDTKRWLNLCIKYHDDYYRILKEASCPQESQSK